MTFKKVLIIGLGFAGNRFLRVFSFFNQSLLNEKYEIGFVDNDPNKLLNAKNHRCFQNIDDALENFSPDIAVVTVNEKYHFEILQKLLTTKTQLILCEKPLVENMLQALVIHEKAGSKHININMVERFSPIIQAFFEWKKQHKDLKTSRVEFFWGKNRVKDTRHTIGVISEIIHPLDLVKYIFGYKKIEITNAISTKSDFSISDEFLIDSLDLIATADEYTILGHSSFMWTKRHREITGFLKHSTGMYRVNFNFDKPSWDCDQLIIDHFLPTGEIKTVFEYQTTNNDFPQSLHKIYKVSEFVRHSINVILNESKNKEQIVNLSEAVQLQQLLEKLVTVSGNNFINQSSLFNKQLV